MQLDVYFDVSSPWSYLGVVRITALGQELGVTPNWRPVIAGGVFNAVNKSLYERRSGLSPERIAMTVRDWGEWGEAVGITIVRPQSWPVNSIKAMRGCAWLQHDQAAMMRFARAAYEAHWGQGLDISLDEVMQQVCVQAGVDGAAYAEAVAGQPMKDLLRANTEELIQRGGYGVPTYFLDDEIMYFGQDHVPLLRRRILAKQGRASTIGDLNVLETSAAS
ncbi:2-hydroxychromene-2-carboxylate isomerase [Phenylobacterium sp.]|uniref:2-hydroxychromene-2-carboxylate isomerase n=1 Tax=Phenylobacterium sp. TaxID=1871053 RepID=UPI002736E568|nr:2-hydroxychromene-2-carboxylate isomerase [Phenylobacterium sp.]MDP3659575.1 2-hydroxychromene-2-carboxylate isomerase [Phenylobacterium sp.]